MQHLKPVLEHIINGFNNRCEDESYRSKCAPRVMKVRDQMVGIKNNQGVIVAACRRSKPAPEGNHYDITISESHYHCSCIGFATSKYDDDGHKLPCKHIIFTACSVAIHMGRAAC